MFKTLPLSISTTSTHKQLLFNIGTLDYQLAFELAPIGLAISNNRTIVDCNEQFCEIFGARKNQMIGQSFQILYPSIIEFEHTGSRIAPILNTKGHYADNRMMRRFDGVMAGELFWCHVTGRALDRDDPHATGIWSFEDLSTHRPVKINLTTREREVATHLLEGLTSKQIGKVLNLSHRTIEIYRARLMRKLNASTTGELVHKLLSQ